MKIAAVMGSPHKGNTLEITQRIEEKLTKFGDVDFEYIHLKDLDLKPCRGCFLCFERGEAHCPLKDDKEKIAEQLDQADGVIFVSPVYSMHVTYLFKLFVDRFAYNFHRPRYFGKYAIGVAAAGNPGLKEALRYLKMVSGSWGFGYVDGLGFNAPPKNSSLKQLIIKKDRTDEVVRKFHKAIKEKKPRKLKLSDYLHFHATRAVYSRLKEQTPTDYKYFRDKGWLDKGTKYFSGNFRGNIFKSLIARLMAGMMGRQIDKALSRTNFSDAKPQ